MRHATYKDWLQDILYFPSFLRQHVGSDMGQYRGSDQTIQTQAVVGYNGGNEETGASFLLSLAPLKTFNTGKSSYTPQGSTSFEEDLLRI